MLPTNRKLRCYQKLWAAGEQMVAGLQGPCGGWWWQPGAGVHGRRDKTLPSPTELPKPKFQTP